MIWPFQWLLSLGTVPLLRSAEQARHTQHAVVAAEIGRASSPAPADDFFSSTYLLHEHHDCAATGSWALLALALRKMEARAASVLLLAVLIGVSAAAGKLLAGTC